MSRTTVVSLVRSGTFFPLVLVPMAIPELRKSGKVIDCMACIGDAEPVRAFLQLPNQDGPGLLRMVESGGVGVSNDHLEGVRLNLLEGHDSGPACLPNCYVRAVRFGISETTPYPAEIAINSAIVGSEDAEQTYPSISISNHRAVRFLDRNPTTTQEVVTNHAVREERASVPFGEHQMQLLEIGIQDNSGDEAEVTVRWWTEIVLTGPPKTLVEWSNFVMPALALLSFCLDEPLSPERIHTMEGSRLVDLHLRWRENSAPSRPPPLMTLDKVGDRFAQVAETWGRIQLEAPELMWQLVEYQLRRGHRINADQFVLVARCLELYFSYSERFESVMRPPDEHRQLVMEVLDGMSPELREQEGEWIERNLLGSNRASLLDQIRRILDSFDGEVLRYCGVPEDREEFARTVRDTRNFFTHLPSERPPRVPDGRGLVALNHRLWFLLRACLLRDMGFEDPEMVELLAAAGQSHYLIRG
jgi:hypothetical protein